MNHDSYQLPIAARRAVEVHMWLRGVKVDLNLIRERFGVSSTVARRDLAALTKLASPLDGERCMRVVA